MLRRFLTGFVVAVMLARVAAAGPFEDRVAAEERGAYSEAMNRSSGTIAIHGPIKAGCEIAFRSKFRQQEVAVSEFSSPGGEIFPALEIGPLIATAKILPAAGAARDRDAICETLSNDLVKQMSAPPLNRDYRLYNVHAFYSEKLDACIHVEAKLFGAEFVRPRSDTDNS